MVYVKMVNHFKTSTSHQGKIESQDKIKPWQVFPLAPVASVGVLFVLFAANQK